MLSHSAVKTGHNIRLAHSVLVPVPTDLRESKLHIGRAPVVDALEKLVETNNFDKI